MRSFSSCWLVFRVTVWMTSEGWQPATLSCLTSLRTSPPRKPTSDVAPVRVPATWLAGGGEENAGTLIRPSWISVLTTGGSLSPSHKTPWRRTLTPRGPQLPPLRVHSEYPIWTRVFMTAQCLHTLMLRIISHTATPKARPTSMTHAPWSAAYRTLVWVHTSGRPRWTVHWPPVTPATLQLCAVPPPSLPCRHASPPAPRPQVWARAPAADPPCNGPHGWRAEIPSIPQSSVLLASTSIPLARPAQTSVTQTQ